MIKTVRRDEMRVLMELIPGYYQYAEHSHHMLLTRFFGVHKIKPLNGRKVSAKLHCQHLSLTLLVRRCANLELSIGTVMVTTGTYILIADLK